MNNNFLKYMMSNDPNETISQKGSDVRKKIRPVFLSALKLGNKLDLEVEKNEAKDLEGPAIYLACHGFKDDALNTILTIKDDTYIVVGNIDLFFSIIHYFKANVISASTQSFPSTFATP